MISAVFQHTDGYRFEERYGDKDSFRRALKRKHAEFLHAVDYEAGIVIRPATIWGYLRS